MLKDLIKQLADTLEIEPPNPNDNGEYSFTLDDSHTVEISSRNNDEVLLHTPIGDPLKESEDNKELLKNVLQWNLVRLKENHEILTWEPETNQLVLFKQIPTSDLSEKPISKQLEDFLNNLEFWNNAIKEGPNNAASRLPV